MNAQDQILLLFIQAIIPLLLGLEYQLACSFPPLQIRMRSSNICQGIRLVHSNIQLGLDDEVEELSCVPLIFLPCIDVVEERWP